MDGCDAPLRDHSPGGFGFSVPIQNPFNPFTVADYASPGGFDSRFPQSQSSAAPPGSQFTTFVRYLALEAGPRTFKITTNNYEFTAASKVTWVSLEIILRHGTGKPDSVTAKIAAWSATAGLSTPMLCVR